MTGKVEETRDSDMYIKEKSKREDRGNKIQLKEEYLTRGRKSAREEWRARTRKK